LYRDSGVPASRTAYARVFVHVQGEPARYAGLYSVIEQVDERFALDRFGTNAAIFKPFTRVLFPDLGPSWNSYRDLFNPRSTYAIDDANRLVDLCRLVATADDATFGRRIGQIVDLDTFARFLAVAVWLADPDSALDGGKNFYLVLSAPTRPFTFVPWDLDHAFGQYPLIEPRLLQELDIYAPARRGDNRLVTRLLKLPAFRDRYLAGLDRIVRDKADDFAAQVDGLAAILRPAVAEESASVLSAFDRAVAGLPVSRAGNGGIPIKPFVAARTRFVRTQLDLRTH
jgi:hypothetical protein